MGRGVRDVWCEELEMARQLRWWSAAVLGGWGIMALAYLPPRARPVIGQRYFRPFQTFEPTTPYRLRVQELANRYRAVSFELEMRELKKRLEPEIARRRALDIPGPALFYAGPDSLSDSARGLVRALLDTAWSQLGLGVTKISVGVVVSVVFDRTPATGTPGTQPVADAFLLPDSTDRTTCLAFVPIIYWGRPGALKNARPAPSPALVERFRNGLGVCAYFAALGSPGHEIARWLASRRFDLALLPWGLRIPRDSVAPELSDSRKPWFWWSIYRFQPSAVGCMAGREDACRQTVLASDTSNPESPTVTREQIWRHAPALVGAGRYFADVASDIGPERFGRFWNSELPVDTALTAALRMPVGEWTRRWQASIVQPIRLGPTASLGATLLALLLGIVAFLLVALTAARREVR
jgi:hypothetical protein